MPELKDIATGKLSTRESLIREIQERAKAELVTQEGRRYRIDGPLGEQIALVAGQWDLALASAEDVAEGICTWLEKTFLQSPQDFDPRAETDTCSPTSGVPSKSSEGGGDGLSRVAASENLAVDGHCPFCGQDVPAKAVV
jgi:hypothetical protein